VAAPEEKEMTMMKRLVRPVLALAVVLAPVTATLAQTQKPAKAQPTHHTVKGTIEAYDAAAHSLSLKTAKGPHAFDVSAAKFWSGSKSVGAEQLATSVGSEASVSYTTKDGKRHASAVHITVAAAKPVAK
jgi:hypothetical protein